MYLYIWEGDGVLTDYTSGMIVALAPNLDEAYKAIFSVCDYARYERDGVLHSSFPEYPTTIVDLNTAKPQAYVCWGGA